MVADNTLKIRTGYIPNADLGRYSAANGPMGQPQV
jgi:hypothetical protein